MFNGPDIRKMVNDEEFNDCLDPNELIAWDSINALIHGLFGNTRAENYKVTCVQIILFLFTINRINSE